MSVLVSRSQCSFVQKPVPRHIKGSSSVLKIGTKVRGIRLVDSDHNIDCKIPCIGPIGLKFEFVKKAT